ncbi:MAG: transposase [Thermoplasmatales archaeon]|nr:transposase [Thermoplasmatales archaeon]
MKKTYQYRAYPSQSQKLALNHQMYLSKRLYNLLLEQSQKNFKETGKTSTKYDMNRWITEFKKKNPEFNEMYAQVCQNIADRVSKGYKNFFRRIKERKQGKKVRAGFPRFKSYVSSLTYPQSGFKPEKNKVSVSKIGNINFVKHREMEGRIKTFTIKKIKSQEWYITFSVEKEDTPLHTNGKPIIGMDLGLKEYATLSDRTRIPNPRLSNKSIGKIKMAQRRLSNKKKGGRNRKKAKIRLAKVSEHIARQRDDFIHKTSYRLVNSYSFIAYEELKIANMVKNHNLARQITDASWGNFTRYLCYKAESAGCRVVGVNPKNTTRTCSGCGNIQDIELSERTYLCRNCGLEIDRDLNASINILATAGLAGSNASGDAVRPQQKANVVESGTTFGGSR